MFGFFRTHLDLPVADISGRPGKTLLVTAGMDGDEYAPIAAAFAAAEKYKEANFHGRLIILPIVNISGFEAGVSENPLDKKFPKYCIPGSRWGTSSERLMYHIVHTYARYADFWLDLHSGAQDEITQNCAWNALTGVADVDARGETFCTTSGLAAAVREPAGRAAKMLATFGCTYVLAESEDTHMHEQYIERAMQALGMVGGSPSTNPVRIFKKTRDIYTLDEYVHTNEMVLWSKLHNAERTGARVGEIAYDEQSG